MTPSEIRAEFALRNQSIVGVLQFFADSHLPIELQEIVTPIRAVAFHLVSQLQDGPELTVALRKLVEAKDAFVRHTLILHNFELPSTQPEDPSAYEHSCVNCSDA